MQMSNNISGITGPKFIKFLSDVEELSWMLRCDISTHCKMPAQTIKAVYANFSPSRATKLVAMATSLDGSLPNS